MRSNPYQNYLENEILTADPMKLVVLLYRGALDSIGSARRHIAAGDIRARSSAITKAMEIVSELVRSLDHEKGGQLSQQLLSLYDFVLSMLIEGNTRQADQPLAEAEKVMQTLLEAWQECAVPGKLVAAVASTPRYGSTDLGQERVSFAC